MKSIHILTLALAVGLLSAGCNTALRSAPAPPEETRRAMPAGKPEEDTVSSMQYRGYTIWYIPIPSLPSIFVSGMRYRAPSSLEMSPPAAMTAAAFR